MPEGLELSDESLEGGITPDPGDPYPRPEAPAFIAADPLFVDDDVPTVRSRPALPVLDDPNRSPNPSVCPFLRRQDGGSLVAPVAFAADGQTCVAIGSPRGQSQKQQELVCLRVAHTDCPRYQRGAMVATPAAGAGVAAGLARTGPAIPRATLAALLILVLSAGISFGFVVQRGGIAMPVVPGSPSPTSVAGVETGSPVPTDEALPTDQAVPSDSLEPVESGLESGSPSLAPTLAPTPEPTVAPTPEPTVAPTPTPTVKPSTKPTSSRYKLLTACPDKADCWIYKVKSGDNLYSIARYFGHPLKTIYAWNPRYPKASLHVGDQIRMPPPTR